MAAATASRTVVLTAESFMTLPYAVSLARVEAVSPPAGLRPFRSWQSHTAPRGGVVWELRRPGAYSVAIRFANFAVTASNPALVGCSSLAHDFL